MEYGFAVGAVVGIDRSHVQGIIAFGQPGVLFYGGKRQRAPLFVEIVEEETVRYGFVCPVFGGGDFELQGIEIVGQGQALDRRAEYVVVDCRVVVGNDTADEQVGRRCEVERELVVVQFVEPVAAGEYHGARTDEIQVLEAGYQFISQRSEGYRIEVVGTRRRVVRHYDFACRQTPYVLFRVLEYVTQFR